MGYIGLSADATEAAGYMLELHISTPFTRLSNASASGPPHIIFRRRPPQDRGGVGARRRARSGAIPVPVPCCAVHWLILSCLAK